MGKTGDSTWKNDDTCGCELEKWGFDDLFVFFCEETMVDFDIDLETMVVFDLFLFHFEL